MGVVAVIPARGGSKGIPRKNIVSLNGKPLVSYSIEHALSAPAIERVIVSTEDEEIAAIARAYGAEVPFLRPAELAEDHILDLPVFEHVLDWLEAEEGYVPDCLVHLRPTSPFRKAGWIDQAVNLLKLCPDADSVRSVSAPAQHPYRVFRIGSDGFLDPVMKHEHPVPFLLRRQELPPMYYYNCVIDITRPSTIREQSSMTGARILPFVMDSDDAFDIDTPRDLQIAHCLLKG